MQAMFAGCLAEDASTDSDVGTAAPTDLGDVYAAVRGGTELVEDVAFKNLEGEGAREIAEKWADSGRMRKKLVVMKEFLPAPHRRVVEQILEGRYRPSSKRALVEIPKPSRMGRGSGSDTEPTSSSPPPEPAPPRRGIQGRATIEQTRAAMARLSSSSSNMVPKALRSPSVDSQSENEGSQHDFTIRFLLGDKTAIPSGAFYAERTSSPLPEEPVAGPSRTAGLLDLPLTPRSKAASQDLSHWLRSSSPPPEEPERPMIPESRAQTQGLLVPDESGQPRTPRRATLGSPFELTTARNGKMVSIPTPDTHARRSAVLFKEEQPPLPHTPPTSSLAPAATILPRRKNPSPEQRRNSSASDTSQDVNSSPLLELRNLRKRPSPSAELEEAHHRAAPPSPKRRRVSSNAAVTPPRARPAAMAPAPTLAREDNATVMLTASSGRRGGTQLEGAARASVSAVVVAGRLASLGPDTRSSVQIVAAAASASARPVPIAASISAPTGIGKTGRMKTKGNSQRQALKLAEKLAQAAPDFVTPAFKAKLERRKLREQSASTSSAVASASASSLHLNVSASASTSASSNGATNTKILPQLPSQDEEMSPDMAARTQQLEAKFKQELARGVRPGLVIPRLRCLESQEEEEL